MRGRIAEHARDLGRRERQLGEALRIGRPRHDVDALAVQLVDDRLHARALEADARAHRIDRVVAREHGDLGAAADFAGGRADLDDVLLDLRDLELEQRLHEQRVATAQDEARALGRLLDALEHGADRLALVEVLAVVLLAIRNDRFRFAELVEHDDELAALDLLDFAGEQVADARRELVADAGALAFADALDDALLGGLDGGAAEDREVDRLFHDVARLEARRRTPWRRRRRSGCSSPRRVATTVLRRTMRMSPLPSSMSTSACTFGPYFLARAARMPSCSSAYSSARSSCLVFDTSRNAARISAELTIQDPSC